MVTNMARLTGPGSPFEIVETSEQGAVFKVFRYGPATLLDIYRRARSCGDRIALVSDARKITYRQLFEISSSISREICSALSDPFGARIALAFANVPEWVAAFIAATSLGATAVTPHRSWHPRDMIAALDSVDCDLVICDSEIANALEQGKSVRRTIVPRSPDGRSRIPFAGSLLSSSDEMPAGTAMIRPDHVALIAFTSGSTGLSKPVELTHRGIVCGVMNTLLGGALASRQAAGVQRSTKPFTPAPFLATTFSHVSGYGAVLLTMYIGGTILTTQCLDPSRAVDLMRAGSATSLVGITSEMLTELLQQPELPQLAATLRSVVIQGTALQAPLVQQLKSVLPAASVGVGYGLTETNGSICVASEATLSHRPTTCGIPLPTVDLRIRREDGTEAPTGEIGEITIRGTMLMRGYANLPLVTARALKDGWLNTGDLGSVDSEGFLYLVARSAQSVNYGQSEISLAEIERVVLDNGFASEAFAFGIEDGTGTVRLVVAVTGAHTDGASIVGALIQAGYGAFAIPRVVKLSTPIPKTPSGKVDRHELRRRLLSQM